MYLNMTFIQQIYSQLVALLREVKYLEQRENTDQVIPESATAVFAQNETYRKYLQVKPTAVAAHGCCRILISSIPIVLSILITSSIISDFTGR